MRVVSKLIIFITLLLAGFFIYRSFRLQVGFIDKAASACLHPFFVVHNKCINPIQQRYASWRESKRELGGLIQEKEKLLLSCQNLQSENIELQAALTLSKDIKELRKFRDRCYPKTGNIVQVVVKSFAPHEHSFLIDSGESDGVREDMVAVYKNCLVGRVTQVFPTYSKVLLLTDKSCTVAGYCFKTRATGIYGGEHEDAARFKYVNHLQKVRQGDRIISSGQGVIYPAGLGLGTVKDVQPNGVSYDITVKPLIDLSQIDYCILLQK
ncbi:MAG TPA: rod shape-determining protein MreC [Candidatus Babeliales bacterium]|nr:rod shape-determining protein MreC [Candidatus Babeliales bacterium]